MADSRITFVTALDNKTLERDLRNTKKKIQSLKEQVYKKEQEKLPLVSQYKELAIRVDEANHKLAQMQDAQKGTYSNSKIKEQAEEVRALERQFNIVGNRIDGIDRSISKTNISLDLEAERAGVLASEIAKAASNGNDLDKNTKKTSKTMQELEKRTKRFGTRMRGIVSSALVFNLVSSGLREMADWFGESVKSNEEASKALAKLKGALLTLAAPLQDVLIPLLTDFLYIITDVVTAIASLTSALFGTTFEASKDAAKDYSESLDDVSDSAKKATQNLSGLDEINTWSSGTSSSDSISPDFNISDVGGLSGIIKFTLQDILFDWGSDITAENIATKIATLFTMASGAIIGWSIGGLGGALVGLTIGAILGVVFGSITFDGDGKISTNEAAKLIKTAFAAIIGGVIGFTIGGVVGSAIGITLTTVLTLVVDNVIYDMTVKGTNLQNIKNKIAELSTFSADLKVKISSLTGEVDESTKADFSLAKKLVEDIFTIDANDNKTAQQIDELKWKIEQLNSLDLGGISLSFDSVTGHVTKTKEEVLKLLQAQYEQLKLEALSEDWKAAYRAQFEAKQAQKDAESEYQKAYNAYVAADNRRKLALAELRLTDAYKYAKQAEEAKKAMEDSKALAEEYEKAYTDASKRLADLEEELGNVAQKVYETSGDAANAGKEFVNSFAYGVKDGKKVAENAVKSVLESCAGIAKRFELSAGIQSIAMGGLLGVQKFPSISVPGLATGAVIPPNREFLAVLGDQKSGTNIEAPLDTIKQAVAEVLAGQRGGNSYSVNATANGRVLFRLIIDEGKAEQMRTGSNPFILGG